MLVRRYERPEKVGNIFLPKAYRTDLSGILWEFVRGHPPYESKDRMSYGEKLGTELTEGDIIQANSTMAATDIGQGFFLMRAGNVQCVHPWVTADD